MAVGVERGMMFKRFIADEIGAVTIDWVILTAGIVVMAIAAISVFKVDEQSVATLVVCNSTGETKTVMPLTGNPISKLIVGTRTRISSFGSYIATGNGCAEP